MPARIFLGLMGILWLGYGAWCFADPLYLQSAAGVAATSLTGVVDLRATYGGLQMAIGALLLGGALRAALTAPVLLMYGVLCAGIGSARLAAALLAGEWSGYTLAGVCLELGSVAIVLLLLRTQRDAA